MQKEKTAVALLSVASNVALVVFKLIIGLAIGSVSVLSEAIHSAVDLLAAVIALVAVRRSGKPVDRGHPYGHGKIENVSGTIEALLIFLAAGWIIYEAVKRLIHPNPDFGDVGWGVGIMLVSSLVNLIVSHLLFKVGKATDSPALQADAWHLRTDVWTSAGVMVGLAVIWIGGRVLPGLRLDWIDPVAAIAVALLIVSAAWHLTRDAGRDLLDASLPQNEAAWIGDCVRKHGAAVYGFEGLRTRKAGATRFFEFELLLAPELLVEESLRIADCVRKDIRRRFPGAKVMIHLEPHQPETH